MMSIFYPSKAFACVFILAGVSALRAAPPSNPAFLYDVRAEGWLKPGGFDMPAAVARFTVDRQTLERYYGESTLSPERNAAFSRFFTTWLHVLNQVPFDSLDRDGRVDYLLLHIQIGRMQQQAAAAKKSEAEASVFLPFASTIGALDDDLRRFQFSDGKQAAITLRNLTAQIQGLVADINAGRLSGTAVTAARSARMTQVLHDTLSRWFHFYDKYDPSFTWWVAEPWKDMDAALTSYSNLLRDKVAGAANRDTIIGDPAGRETVDAALKAEVIPYAPEELIAFARKELAWCKTEMINAGRQLGYGDDWRKALEHVKNDYVPPGEQPALIRDLADEATRFVEQRNLVTIPPAVPHTWRMEMMTPERQRINPFFTGGDVMSVSYPTAEMTEEQKLMSMRGNNVHFARATVFHELVPGHYLQEYMEERYRPWRAEFQTPFWVEGWAFYWEMLLWDLDFPRSPEDRIGMLFWRMHRAARVIFSLSFHLGEMTAAQAVDFLVNEVGHERENAAAEVRRSFESESHVLYQCAYEIGAMQLRALHAELVDSGKMSNREFHDSILKLNAMPVEMVRASLLNQKLSRDFQPAWKFIAAIPATKHAAK